MVIYRLHFRKLKKGDIEMQLALFFKDVISHNQKKEQRGKSIFRKNLFIMNNNELNEILRHRILRTNI